MILVYMQVCLKWPLLSDWKFSPPNVILTQLYAKLVLTSYKPLTSLDLPTTHSLFSYLPYQLGLPSKVTYKASLPKYADALNEASFSKNLHFKTAHEELAFGPPI